METLPIILLTRVFHQLTIRDAINASYVSRTLHTTLAPYLLDTYNVPKYLSSSFSNPAGLLNTFRRSGAVLSGSRALAYVIPSIRSHTATSDWDIYVPYPHQLLVHDELVRQGFNAVERTKQARPHEFWVFDYYNGGEKVQLVALVQGHSLFDCFIDFHASIVQNFISGWGCYCMHWKTTFDGWGWIANRLDAFPKYRIELVAKEAARGMRLVPWKDRDLEECTQVKVFAVKFPGSGVLCGVQEDMTLNEFQSELQLSERQMRQSR